jgi:tetratricopeptide (TPR) repeat protein
MREKTEDQLQAILAAPDDWLPEAFAAARAEMQRRGVEPTKVVAAAAPALEPAEDVNRQILLELRRLRRSNELATYFVLAVLVLAGAYIYWRVRQSPQRSQPVQQAEQLHRSRSPARAERSRPWDEVSDATDRFDYPKAISLLQGLIARQPSYYYGYAYLGNVYLATGDLTNAEAHFLRAYELLPDEENEKPLAAIRKRIVRERGLGSSSR